MPFSEFFIFNILLPDPMMICYHNNDNTINSNDPNIFKISLYYSAPTLTISYGNVTRLIS